MFDSPGMIPANRDGRKKVLLEWGSLTKSNLKFLDFENKKKTFKKILNCINYKITLHRLVFSCSHKSLLRNRKALAFVACQS